MTKYIYLGPSLRGLNYGNIFTGFVPSFITQSYESVPEIKQLFVTPEGLVRAKERLKSKGSGLQLAYETVVKAKKEGVIK